MEKLPYGKESAQILVAASVVAVVLAAIGFFIADIWLDSTRWLLVAILLAVWGIYFQLQKK